MSLRFTFLLLLFSMRNFGQGILDTSELLLNEQIRDVEIFSNTIKLDQSIALSRKQFLTLSGALEDPTRLLIKYPGISTANDQANSVIYHGLPSQYHRWALYGARILNPNHLGNAGTISDFPSRSAGGVNMMSGQVIGSLEFNGNPSEKTLDALAASSNIKLRDPYKNGISTNMSLIGLEAGIDRMSKDGQSNFLLNYRYSTVGLLTSLGLDFGGEAINYQDVTSKYSRRFENGGKLDVYFSGGINSNLKDPIPLGDQPEEYKDLQKIDYNSTNLIGGISYNRNTNEYNFQSTFNISINNTDRTSSIPSSSIFNVSNSAYKSDEILIASKHNYSLNRGKWNVGVTFEPYYHSIILEKDYPDRNKMVLLNSSLNREALHLIPSIFAKHNLSSFFVLSGRIGTQTVLSSEHNTKLIGQVSLDYSQAGLVSSLSFSRASQVYQPEILIYSIEPDLALSHNIEWSATYKGVGLSAFYHNVFNVPISTSDYGFSGFENLDNLPIPIGTDPLSIRADGEADIYGLSISYVKSIGGINVLSNLTLMNSNHYGPEETTKAPLDYGHVFNISVSKSWSIGKSKEFGISSSFHHRGGARQNQVDLNNSFQWGYTNYSYENQFATRLRNYYRMDLRLIYKPSKRSTISLDIQNVLNRENDAYYFYEAYYGASTLRKQLGMIPILGWRVDW